MGGLLVAWWWLLVVGWKLGRSAERLEVGDLRLEVGGLRWET